MHFQDSQGHAEKYGGKIRTNLRHTGEFHGEGLFGLPEPRYTVCAERLED